MEETTRWYKKHLCGFSESFEKDMAIKFMDELEVMFEYIVAAMIEDYNIHSCVENNKDLFEEYLKQRAREVVEMGEEPWYIGGMKVHSRFLPKKMQPQKYQSDGQN